MEENQTFPVPAVEDDLVIVPPPNTVSFDSQIQVQTLDPPAISVLAPMLNAQDTMVLEDALEIPNLTSAPVISKKKSNRQFLSTSNAASVSYDRSRSQYSSCNQWLAELRSRQSDQMTPEIQERIAAKARRQRRRGKKCKRAKTYQRCNMISRNAYWSGVSKSMSSSAAVRQDAVNSRAQMQSLNSAFQRRAHRDYETLDLNEEAEEDAVEEMLSNLEVVQQTDAVAVNLMSNERGIRSVLNQLRVEPNNDAELATKFGLYEDYLSTVEESRKATHDFWDDCKEEFTGPTGQSHVATSIQKSVDDIDKQENMGIIFHEHRWFVYDMTQQADRNNTKLKDLLHQIEIKLELLNKEDDDCPFCLESLEDKEHITLGCCHKACTECWSYWQELRGRGAFCPLCRQTDFLENILSA